MKDIYATAVVSMKKGATKGVSNPDQFALSKADMKMQTREPRAVDPHARCVLRVCASCVCLVCVLRVCVLNVCVCLVCVCAECVLARCLCACCVWCG